MSEIIKVDNTILCDCATCDALTVAKNVLGLRSKGEKIAADIGNVFHDALEEHFKGGGPGEVLKVFDEGYGKVLPVGSMPPEDRFGFENCRKILGRYIEERPLDRIERELFRVVELERVVGREIAPGIMFYAKRDLLVEDVKTGMRKPVDHKTTRKINDWWVKKFRMSSQMSGYCWITGEESGQVCLESLVNAIELGKVPDSTRKCSTHKVAYQECGVLHMNNELLVYQRKPEMIERWKQDAIGIAKAFGVLKRGFPSVDYLPFARRNGAFNNGCTFCEMQKWCATGFDKDFMEEEVVRDPWEPWESESF